MNFRKKLQRDQPELNFIPLIDVLLVIIIFLVVSTTFSKFSELSKKNQDKMPVIISADANTNHQSVVNVMEASRRAGLTKITFSTKVN